VPLKSNKLHVVVALSRQGQKVRKGTTGNRKESAEIQVAEGARQEPLGFVSLQTATDFTGEMHAYISDLVVRPTAEGRGVGAALLREAEP
jgi:ribosomal protein S18 acetylase RimI-like enzyme